MVPCCIVKPYGKVSPVLPQLLVDFLFFLLRTWSYFAIFVGFRCKQIMQIRRYELLLQKGVVVGMSYVEQTLAVQVRLQTEIKKKKLLKAFFKLRGEDEGGR